MSDILSFALLIGKSKKIKRSGWLREGIKDSESVAEHCFRLSVFSMVLAKTLGVNQEKLIKMAIIHDLGETKTGDIVVERGRTIDVNRKTKKEAGEKKIVDEVLSQFGSDYSEIFQEMVERKTNDSIVFWQLDKLEMAIQAFEYEKEHNIRLDEFFLNASMHVVHPILKAVLEDVARQRKRDKLK